MGLKQEKGLHLTGGIAFSEKLTGSQGKGRIFRKSYNYSGKK